MTKEEELQAEANAKFFNDRCFTCGGTKKITIQQPCPDCMEIDVTSDLKDAWEVMG